MKDEPYEGAGRRAEREPRLVVMEEGTKGQKMGDQRREEINVHPPSQNQKYLSHSSECVQKLNNGKPIYLEYRDQLKGGP